MERICETRRRFDKLLLTTMTLFHIRGFASIVIRKGIVAARPQQVTRKAWNPLLAVPIEKHEDCQHFDHCFTNGQALMCSVRL
jgi:hypothetical protein